MQQSPAGVIQIVEMMIMAEQHVVERLHLIGGESRARELMECGSAGFVGASSRIECRIRQKSEPAKFEQRGRPANISDLQKSRFHTRIGFCVCCGRFAYILSRNAAAYYGNPPRAQVVCLSYDGEAKEQFVSHL